MSIKLHKKTCNKKAQYFQGMIIIKNQFIIEYLKGKYSNKILAIQLRKTKNKSKRIFNLKDL